MTEVVALPPSIPARARWPLSLVVGLVLTATVIATALIALVWTPYDPAAVDIAAKLTAPSAAHWMGTDHFGRDVLSMIMAGARNSLIVALVAVGGFGRGELSPFSDLDLVLLHSTETPASYAGMLAERLRKLITERRPPYVELVACLDQHVADTARA